MIETSSKIQTGFKYVYLVMFFALLAGFFHPIITGSPFDIVVLGVIVLFVGLVGAILVYKATSSEKRRIMYFGGGFGLIAISLALIFQFTGRV